MRFRPENFAGLVQRASAVILLSHIWDVFGMHLRIGVRGAS